MAEPGYSVFPSRLVTQRNTDRGDYISLYHEVKLGQLLLSVTESEPLDAFELQQSDFEDMLNTINWSSLQSVFMPGDALGTEDFVVPPLIPASGVFLVVSWPRSLRVLRPR